MGPQVGEMLGNLHLGLGEDLLDVADAQFAFMEQVQDAQPGLVAEALVDLGEFHRIRVEGCRTVICRNRNIL